MAHLDRIPLTWKVKQGKKVRQDLNEGKKGRPTIVICSDRTQIILFHADFGHGPEVGDDGEA